MLDATAAGGAPLEILARERAIDAEGRARTFGGRDNRELHVAQDVARDEHAGDAGGFVVAAAYAAIAIELAAQRRGKLRLRTGRCVEEQRVARQGFAVT